MRHKLAQAVSLELGEVERFRPRLAAREGVRVSFVAGAPGDLVFRAEGAVPAGVYRERAGTDAERVLADDGGVWLAPRAHGDVIVARFAATAGAPSAASAIGFLRAGADVVRVPGQAVGVSGDGRVALVIDASARRLRRVDLADLSVTEVGEVGAGVDAQTCGPVALDERGEEALFGDSDGERGWLSGVALASDARTQVTQPAREPVRLAGAFVPADGGVLVLETRLGETPEARLLVVTPSGAREVFRASVSQPAAVPVFLSPALAALPLSPKPHGAATYGPVDLYAVDLTSGTRRAVTTTGDVSGQPRATRDAIVVEGGEALMLVAYKP